MASSPNSVYWLGSNGHTYVKSAGVAGGAQDYGQLPSGATIYNSTKIADPNAPINQLAGNGGGGGSSGGGGGGTAPADLSSFDQSINATQANINNLTPGLQNALAGNGDQYQTAINQLNQNKAQTDQTYNRNKLDNSQNYVTTKNSINTNTGNTINGLDRLLASRGAAGESAGDYAALLAAGQGTQQRSAAGTTFGKNQQSLDQNYGNYVNTFNQDVTTAGQQRDEANKQAQVTYDTNRANLLQSLASLVNQRTSAAGGHGTAASQPYVNEANSLLANAASQGAPRAVGAITPLTYTAPTLSSYTANPTAVGISASPTAGAATQSALPYLDLLGNRQQQQQGQ